MADNRGGRRIPDKPAAYSGIGKNSRRTDGQPIKTPNVQEGTDLTQGDRAVLERGQRIAPLSRAPSPQVSPRTTPSPAGGSAPGLNELLFSKPTNRPLEDVMAPPITPPEPTDEVGEVLQGLVGITGDASIADMLAEHQEFRAWRANRQAPQPMAQPPEGGEPSQILPTSDEGLPRPSDSLDSPQQGATISQVQPSMTTP